MALSTIVKQLCATCGKVAVEKSRFQFGNTKMIVLACGHSATEGTLASASIDYRKILNGCTLMDYQTEAVKFMEQADARMLLLDEAGLGKTVEVLAVLKLHAKTLLPAIIICPTTVKIQWHHEILNKCGVEGFLTQVIGSGKELAAPGFDIYVTTYDLLKNEKCFELVKDNIKFIAIDECQRIKNHLSDRAKAVQRICKNVEHIVPMSGTPIKNNAGEYFTVLNLVRPRIFPQYTQFVENDCDSYQNGWGYKIGGLKNPEAFKEKTQNFILRRVKTEVLKDLPPLMRKFQHVELNRKLNKAYDAAMTELEELYYKDDMDGMQRSASILVIMNKLRHIVGISKVEDCLEFVQDFLDSNERKITVFTHHLDVADRLKILLDNWAEESGYGKCLHLHSGLNAQAREDLAARFKADDSCRIMIASTQAAGEGINLQFCADAIMLERQWNPANEEQAEGRFHRFGQQNTVSVTYMIASETIDEKFTELVEQKRAYMASTLDYKEIQWDQQSLMSELANILVTTGKKAWKL